LKHTVNFRSEILARYTSVTDGIRPCAQKRKRGRTYDGEFVECFKQLDAEVDVLRVDVGIDEVDKLCSLADDVERFDVVRLLSQVVLYHNRQVRINCIHGRS